MKQYYVLSPGGEKLGPFDEQTLRDQYAAGAYTAATMVQEVGTETWEPITRLNSPLPPLPSSDELQQQANSILATCWPIRVEGRLARKPFWLAVLGLFIANFVGSIAVGILSMTDLTAWLGSLLSMALYLAVSIIGIAITCRRLHDTGRSGWMQLLSLIPLVGWIIVLYFCVQKGQPESNVYGPPTA